MPDPREKNPRYRALIQLLRTAEDLWNASRVFFVRWGLSPSQFNVLNLLHGRPEGLSQSELSRLLLMHRSNATGLVDRLERRGLVRRRDDAQDRRAYRVGITPAGSRLLEDVLPHYFAAADEVWDGLSNARVEQWMSELQRLAASAAAVAGSRAAAASPVRRRTASARQSVTANPRKRRMERPSSPTGDELRTSDL